MASFHRPFHTSSRRLTFHSVLLDLFTYLQPLIEILLFLEFDLLLKPEQSSSGEIIYVTFGQSMLTEFFDQIAMSLIDATVPEGFESFLCNPIPLGPVNVFLKLNLSFLLKDLLDLLVLLVLHFLFT